MKFIGDVKTAEFVLAKVREAKPARDAMIAHDPFEGVDISRMDSQRVDRVRRDRESMRKIDVMLREDDLVVFGFPEVTLSEHETWKESLLPGTSPGTLFRGHSLFIISESLGTATVCDLSVGRGSQFAVPGPIPVEMFSPCSFGGMMNLDTAVFNQPISITLSSSGTQPDTLRAAIFGRVAVKEKNVVKKMDIDITKRAELYADLRRQLDTSANRAMLAHLEDITALESDLPGPRRMPLGLKASSDDVGKLPEIAENEMRKFVASPFTDVRVTHFVLTEEASQYFDMVEFKIGMNSQLLNAASVPLDFFSVAHNQKALAKVSAIRSRACDAGHTIAVYVQRRVDGHGPKAFQGLLWVECE